MYVGPWGFICIFLLPIHTTRQMMFSQNPETSKIRFLDSGFSPVSANSRIALSFDLRPSMNDRSKWKKTEGEGKKVTTPAYSGTITFDESGHRYVSFWSVLKGMYALHIKREVGQKLFGAQGSCVKTVGENTDCEDENQPSLSFSFSLSFPHDRKSSLCWTYKSSVSLSLCDNLLWGWLFTRALSQYLKCLVTNKSSVVLYCKCYAFFYYVIITLFVG